MKEKLDDLIEAYLLNRMSESDRAAFETQVRTQKQLAQALRLAQIERQAMLLLEREHLRAQMDSWKQDIPQETPSQDTVVPTALRIRPLLLRVAAAATITLLVGVPFWYAQVRYGDVALTQGQVGLASVPYERYANASDDAFLRSIDLAAVQRFDEALQVLMPLYDTPQQRPAKMLSAAIHAERKDWAAAIHQYQEIIDMGEDKATQEMAQWRLSNTYVLAGQTEKARILLAEIAQDGNHSKVQEASILLAQMRSPWRKIRLFR